MTILRFMLCINVMTDSRILQRLHNLVVGGNLQHLDEYSKYVGEYLQGCDGDVKVIKEKEMTKSQSKFAVGDKVVCNEEYLHSGENFMFKNREYIVSKCDEYFVEFEGQPNYRYLVKSFDLVQPAFKNMKGMFSNMKFRVDSPEHSKEIQEALFEMGYVWGTHMEKAIPTYAPVSYLYALSDGELFQSKNNWTDFQEFAIQTTKSYKIIPVEIPKEIITIDGKMYDKEAVLKRLAELEVVEG